MDVQQRVSICTGAGLGWAGRNSPHICIGTGSGSALRHLHVGQGPSHERSISSESQAGEIGRAVLRGRPVHLLCGFVLFQERDLESSVQRLMNERSHLKPSL